MALSRKQELGFRKSHAFVIGINEYRGLDANLRTAEKDAQDIAMRLKVLQGFDHVLLMNNVGLDQIRRLLRWLVPEAGEERPEKLMIPDQVFTYGDDQFSSQIGWLAATQDTELKVDEDLPKLTFNWNKEGEKQTQELVLHPETTLDIQESDSLVFYYAGHGFPGEVKAGPAGYLSPTDTKFEFEAVNNESLLPMDEVYQAFSKVNCKHTLLLLDCCFAGKFRFSSLSRGRKPFIQPLYKRRFERYKSSAAWQVLVSSGPEQTANDSAKWANIRENSPFAAVLKEALEGKADLHTFGNKTQGDGIITATELFLYIWNKVEKITSKRKVQHPGLFPMAQHREGEFIFLNPNISSDAFRFAKDPDRNPYKGLLTYEPEDANLFFGRDKALSSLLRKITTLQKNGKPPVIFLTAPSAAGKSSLIKAGLFPALQKKHGYEELLIFRPASVDLIAGQSIVPNEVRFKGEYGRSNWTGFSVLEARLDASKSQMILLDQFEEFFSELESKAMQDAFESALLSLIDKEQTKREHPLIVCITLRSDVEWRMPMTKLGGDAGKGQINYWNTDHIFRLQPMDLDELREALTGPAWWALHDFKNSSTGNFEDDGEELINQILKDVMYYPAALPMLSCVMQLFYDKAKGGNQNLKLVKADYDQLGGVEGALSARAENFFQQQDEVTQQLMRKILLRMVYPGDGAYSRRKVTYFEPRKEALPEEASWHSFFELDFGEDGGQLKRLIDEMEANFLLVQGKDKNGLPIVEPAHDALINHWPTCRQWINDFGQEQLLLQRDLWAAVLHHSKISNSGRSNPKEENFNMLWEGNLKLNQLLKWLLQRATLFLVDEQSNPLQEAIAKIEEDLAAKDRQIFKKLIKAWKKKQYIKFDTFIITGASQKLLKVVLQTIDHWLNKKEVRFIKHSWKIHSEGILELKKERDIALARALAGKARQVYNYDHTLALRLAYNAYQDVDLIQASRKELVPVFEDICSTIHDIASNNDSHFYQKSLELDEIPHSVACTPDGKILAVGQQNNKISLWEVDTGKWIRDITAITRAVRAVAFSPDGKYLVSGGQDRMVKLWDWEKPEQPPVNIPAKGKLGNDVSSLAFSPNPNDKFIAIGTRNGSGTLLYNRQTKELKKVGERSNSVAISPNGKYLAYGNDNNAAIVWEMGWETIKEENLHKLAPGGGDVEAVTFSPNSQLLLTTSGWGAKLWRVSDGQELVEKRMEGHSSTVQALAFSPDGQYVITGSDDHTVRMYDVGGDGVREIKCFKGHKGWVQALTFTPDGRHIITASHDQTVKIQRFSTAKEIAVFQSPDRVITGVDFSNSIDEPVAGFSGKTKAFLWKMDALVPSPPSIIEQKRETSTVKFFPDGQFFLTGGDTKDKEVRVWRYEAGQVPTFWQRCKHGRRVKKTSFSKDGKHLLTGGWGKAVKVWNLDTLNQEEAPEPIQIITQSANVISLAFMDDNQHYITVDQHAILRVWHINDAQNEKNSFKLPGGVTNSLICFSKTENGLNRQFILSTRKTEIRLWEAKELAKSGNETVLIRTFLGHSSAVTVAIISNNGKYMLSGSDDRTARLWDVQSGGLLQTFGGHSAAVLDVAFSKDDRYILTGSKDGFVKWWHNPMWQLENRDIPALTKTQREALQLE